MTTSTAPSRPAPPLARADWRSSSACQGVDIETLFSDSPGKQKQVQGICRGCPERLTCLSDAVAYEESTYMQWGVVGGLTSLQRRALRVAALLGQVPDLEQARVLAAPQWAGFMYRVRLWPADLVAEEFRRHGVIASPVTVRVALWWSGAKASTLRPKGAGDRRRQWQRIRDESREIVAQLREMNVSNRDVAAYLGVCEDSVADAVTAWKRDALAVAA